MFIFIPPEEQRNDTLSVAKVNTFGNFLSWSERLSKKFKKMHSVRKTGHATAPTDFGRVKQNLS